jgi:spermidine synthase
LARKHADGRHGGFGFREADAHNKGFETKYYSAGVHRGALETPPFVRAALDA